MSLPESLRPRLCTIGCRCEVVQVRSDGSGMGWCHDHRWSWPIGFVPYEDRPGSGRPARPHVAEMWMAALFAALARRGQSAVPERFVEAAALAEAVGIVDGQGADAHVAEIDAAHPTAVHAERAFRSWWEARERRQVDEVDDQEAEDLQRDVLRALPVGQAAGA